MKMFRPLSTGAAPIAAPGDRESRFADWRIAVQSILAFWTFYLVTVLARAGISPTAGKDILVRSLYAVVGVALSGLIYVALRSFARNASLQRTALVAVAAVLPASLAIAGLAVELAVQSDMSGSSSFVTKEGAVVSQVGQRLTITPQTGNPLEFQIDLSEAIAKDRARLIGDALVTWFFLFSTWSAIYIGLTLQGRAKENELRLAAAESAAHAAQVRALRYQVNPHFLFNTLNSLSSLVMSGDAERAENMLMALSTFFRSSLSLDPNAHVTLAEEIALQRLYLDIERVRFPDRLEVSIQVPKALSELPVPALILQPLVENAIKYGVSQTRDRVRLTIEARPLDGNRVEVVVTNRLAGIDKAALPQTAPAHAGTGVGLANVCERLKTHFGDVADCRFGPIPGGYRVSLAIPGPGDD